MWDDVDDYVPFEKRWQDYLVTGLTPCREYNYKIEALYKVRDEDFHGEPKSLSIKTECPPIDTTKATPTTTTTVKPTTTLPPLVPVSNVAFEQTVQIGDGITLKMEWVQDFRVQVEINLDATFNPEKSQKITVPPSEQVIVTFNLCSSQKLFVTFRLNQK